MRGRGRALQHRAFLHHDVAIPAARGRRRRGRLEHRCRVVARQRYGQRGKEELEIGVVQQPPVDEVVIDRQRGRHQGVNVDLARSSEDDPVLVDDVDLPLRMDRTEDLRRRPGRIDDFIEGDPLSRVRTPRALVEIEGRIPPDVERRPVEQRLLRGLRDGDHRLPAPGRLHRSRRPLPLRGRHSGWLQAADSQPVRHVGKLLAGMARVQPEVVGAIRKVAGRLLHRLYRIQRVRGLREHVDGILPLLARRGRGRSDAACALRRR